MSRRGNQARRERFFREHPTCCFCGGVSVATTEDHAPNRAVFDQRQWPEGYVFPACDGCNEATRKYEKIMAFLTRIDYGAPLTEAGKHDVRKAMRGIRNEFPSEYFSMKMSANQTRNFLREQGRTLQTGDVLSDVPVLSIVHPTFREAMKHFGIKLFCALHYKHTGEIVPANAAVCGRWFARNSAGPGWASQTCTSKQSATRTVRLRLCDCP